MAQAGLPGGMEVEASNKEEAGLIQPTAPLHTSLIVSLISTMSSVDSTVPFYRGYN